MTRTLSQCSVVAVLPSLSKVCPKVSETDSWLLWRDTELSVSDQLNKATWTGERSFNHFKSHPSFHSTLSALSLWKPPFHPPISYLGHLGNWCKMLNWLKNRYTARFIDQKFVKTRTPTRCYVTMWTPVFFFSSASTYLYSVSINGIRFAFKELFRTIS